MIKQILILSLIISTVGCSSTSGGVGSYGVSAIDADFELIGIIFLPEPHASPRSYLVYYSENENITCITLGGRRGSIDSERGELFGGMR